MSDQDIEKLLSGYRIPQLSKQADARIGSSVAREMAKAKLLISMRSLTGQLLNAFGFGYLWLLLEWLNPAEPAEFELTIF